MKHPNYPLKEMSIDLGLVIGMITAIFAFGVAALPLFPQ